MEDEHIRHAEQAIDVIKPRGSAVRQVLRTCEIQISSEWPWPSPFSLLEEPRADPKIDQSEPEIAISVILCTDVLRFDIPVRKAQLV